MNRAKGENLITLRKRAAQVWPGTNGLYCELRKDELETALSTGILPRELCEQRRKEREERKAMGSEKSATCKYCGQTGLNWHRDGSGKWHLEDVFGARHLCRKESWGGQDKPEEEEDNTPCPFGSDEPLPVPPGAFDEPVKHVSESVRADKPATAAATNIANALEMLMKSTSGNVDADQVRQIVREEIARADKPQSVSLSLTINDLPAVSCDDQHERFPYLLALIAARVPVMLVGPAGSGKTSAAHNVAKALSLPFYAISLGPQTSKSDLMGYMHGGGEYVTSAAREAYEKGGVLLLDEMDAANAGVLTVLNSLLANGVCGFPDKPGGVQRHPDFVVVAAANTFGTGADRQYVGRNQLDAATLDRFFMLDWELDWSLTSQLLGIKTTRKPAECKRSGYDGATWLKRVQSVAAAIDKCKIRHTVGPRAALYGVKLLDVFPREVLEAGLLWKDLPTIQCEQIDREAK